MAAAAWKIPGSGFALPTASETTQPWTSRSSPVLRIFASCWTVRPLVTITQVQPPVRALSSASRVVGARTTRSAAPVSSRARTAECGTALP